jgi:UDP-N-acetylmuramoyl-tripeptide--D-alanyl-D-alanine ligase
MMTLADAHALLPGSRLVGDADTRFERVHSDTRTLRAGDLFVALKGEHHDAHRFLGQAGAQGAVAAIASHGLEAAGLPGLQVDDTLRALQDLAAGWRRRFDVPLVAVTGSNGKTTVTQMIAAILRAWLAERAFSTEGNLNNHIGVPLTLLRLRDTHAAAVIELGMNHPGEIALLARLCAPTVALVNNAQREHQEFMASVEAVARENGAAIQALGPNGVAVFPVDDEQAPVWRALANGRPKLTFALETGRADVTAEALWAGDFWSLLLATPAGAVTVGLRAPGRHNVKNALAATACALAAGAPLSAVVRGLESFEPVKGRSRAERLALGGRTVTLVDDSYNANPDSVRAAIELLAALPGPRWLVLGDMGEVGDRGPQFHAEVGAYARERGIEWFWAAGPLMREAAQAYGAAARHFDAVEALVAALPAEAPACGAVLVKGSRFMRMERVVQALRTPGSAAC